MNILNHIGTIRNNQKLFHTNQGSSIFGHFKVKKSYWKFYLVFSQQHLDEVGVSRVRCHVQGRKVLHRGPWIDVEGFLVGAARLKGVYAGLAIVNAGASVMIQEAAHHTDVAALAG